MRLFMIASFDVNENGDGAEIEIAYRALAERLGHVLTEHRSLVSLTYDAGDVHLLTEIEKSIGERNGHADS